jgi:hypothetical protein
MISIFPPASVSASICATVSAEPGSTKVRARDERHSRDEHRRSSTILRS